ncbi:prolyl oligopeptidase family serine peptidase [Bifidobacterium pullorum subsp. saeculare]|uniref:Prolyl oligopeptidase family serine peptidase n=1 Tax=Bifidobacterium pullorum subsp. saeculare TaxID=78257 RepID=A0A938X0A7_9BIFI|nr:prolyl oligopeptidase family serine peptidase [Bifidobacterium pullorum]MBM6700328.1 prolyl oligopeptidase family serine peptidase [Bifidobacterium pullorum subsp. saeculare]
MTFATDDQTAAIAAYPRAKARTLRFTSGAPRSAKAVGDGSRAYFLRSSGPEDLSCSLWMSWFDAAGGHRETELADARALLGDAADEEIPEEERARRERAREGGAGIVSYSTDGSGRRAVVTLNGRLFLVEVGAASPADGDLAVATRELCACGLPGPVLNPRLSPDGTRVLYTTGERLMLVGIDADAAADTCAAVLGTDGLPSGEWRVGLAEFAAGEEMDRYDGFWWSPASDAAIVERFDASAEPLWTIADPSQPFSYPLPTDVNGAPTPRAEAALGQRHYPQALTHNARVRLDLLRFEGGATGGAAGGAGDGAAEVAVTRVTWDADAYEYLARVSWAGGHDPLLLVQNRRQSRDQVLAVDPATGATRVLEEHANDQWIDIVDGTPALTPDGRMVCAFSDMAADTNRLTVDGTPFTPAGWNVRAVLDVTDADVLALVQRDPARDVAGVPAVWADRADEHDARSMDIVSLGYDGSVEAVSGRPGVWAASRAGSGIVLSGGAMDLGHAVMSHDYTGVVGAGSGSGSVGGVAGGAEVAGAAGAEDAAGAAVSVFHAPIASHAAEPGFALTTRFVTLPGEHGLLAAVTVPSAGSPYAGAASLPVLMRPYGGPGHQEVVFNPARHWDSQWWADQGFVVVTADGRGTTGRGPAWDREIVEDMKDVTLADQVEAVEGVRALAAEDGGGRWRALFAGAGDGADGCAGGAGVPMPDLDRVAMIGWSYGGFLSALAVLDAPDVFKAACAGAPPTDWTLYDTHYTERYLGLDPAVYERNSIVADAPKLRRPLMLIHGFADDNVTIAHSLRLSQALMASGRPHTFLPLVGITHMTNDERVAENLLILQRDFLKENL